LPMESNSGHGRHVANPTSATPSFVAPTMTAGQPAQVLSFTLTVGDALGLSGTRPHSAVARHDHHFTSGVLELEKPAGGDRGLKRYNRSAGADPSRNRATRCGYDVRPNAKAI